MKILTTFFISLFLLVGCSSYSQQTKQDNTLNSSSSNNSTLFKNKTYEGYVVKTEPFMIDNGNNLSSLAVGVGGGALGAKLGSKIGGGKGKKVATVLGGILGGTVGYSVANNMQKEEGVKIHFILKQDMYNVLYLIQKGNFKSFYTGQPILLTLISQNPDKWEIIPSPYNH